MIMWIMSDRAIPRSLPLHGGLRRPHLPPGQRRGQVDLRQVPLEAEAGPAIGRLGRGGQDQRRRPRLPPPRPLGRHRGRRLPGVGARPAALRRGLRRASSTFDVLDATKLIPEELVPVQHRRPDGARPHASTTSSPRPSRSPSARRTSCPGIDFSDDPLLQGRNFSYLDTQLKRLGGPNFTHIPINAPKCPFAHFQQDGHMAMHNPKGRVNYEPNSWGDDGGPREIARAGLPVLPRADGRRRRSGPAPRRSPTTTARPGSSTSARPRSSRRTSPTP